MDVDLFKKTYPKLQLEDDRGFEGAADDMIHLKYQDVVKDLEKISCREEPNEDESLETELGISDASPSAFNGTGPSSNVPNYSKPSRLTNRPGWTLSGGLQRIKSSQERRN